jgi:hypothetical protein
LRWAAERLWRPDWHRRKAWALRRHRHRWSVDPRVCRWSVALIITCVLALRRTASSGEGKQPIVWARPCLARKQIGCRNDPSGASKVCARNRRRRSRSVTVRSSRSHAHAHPTHERAHASGNMSGTGRERANVRGIHTGTRDPVSTAWLGTGHSMNIQEGPSAKASVGRRDYNYVRSHAKRINTKCAREYTA